MKSVKEMVYNQLLPNDVARRSHMIEAYRPAFGEGRLDADGLHLVEDDAISAVLTSQKSQGEDVFTDEEFRRTGFQNDILEAPDTGSGLYPADSHLKESNHS